MDVVEVAIGLVDEPARPLRRSIDPAYIEELAASIQARGLQNPLRVRKVGSRYEVVAGHCRLLALRRIMAGVIPVVVVELSREEVEIEGAHENLIRRNMSIVEEGRLVASLMARESWGVARAAVALHRSERWIRDRIELLGWPADVVGAVDEGRLAHGAAAALMGIEDERDRLGLVGHALRSGCTVDVARRWRDDANRGAGVSGQGADLVGVAGAVVSAPGPRAECFACGVVATYAELTYWWMHRECGVSLYEGLRAAERAAAGPPPGQPAGVTAAESGDRLE